MQWPRVARVADAVVVAALAFSAQLWVWTTSTPLVGGRPVHALLLAAVTLPLVVRRRAPLPVLLLVLGATWLQFELGGGTFQPWFAVLLALYAVAAHADRRPALAGAAGVGAAMLALDVPRLLAGDPVDEVAPAWLVLAGTWGFGRWIRSRRRETERLAARTAAAEHERAEHAARAVADERARIARELHDLVSHSMGVIVIQAQAGQRAVDTDPPTASGALHAIETVGRQGMAELRRLLGLLTGPTGSPTAPQPGLGDLGELVDRVRAAGTTVRLTVAGDLAGLPAGVDLAAYRIVQEALTNVLRHAGPAAAEVHVRRGPGVLEVEVCDDGPAGGGSPGAGHGLVGMRERAALYGGTLEAGPRPGGGYRVHARLTVEGA